MPGHPTSLLTERLFGTIAFIDFYLRSNKAKYWLSDTVPSGAPGQDEVDSQSVFARRDTPLLVLNAG